MGRGGGGEPDSFGHRSDVAGVTACESAHVVTDVLSDLVLRELAALDAAEDDELPFAVAATVAALEGEARLAGALQDLVLEADDFGRALSENAETSADLRMLRRLWEDLGRGLPPEQLNMWQHKQRDADRLLDATGSVLVVGLDVRATDEDSSRIGQLLAFLTGLDVGEGHAIIDIHRGPYEDIRRRRALAHVAEVRQARTHAGVAWLRTRLLASMAGPVQAEALSSVARDPLGAPALQVLANAHGRHWAGVVDDMAFGRSLKEYSSGPGFARGARWSARRALHELRARTDATRSRLAIIDRYKARCEWHDRERVFDLAQAAEGGREDALRNDMALYLFDAGLNPLSEARLGETARADLFAGSTSGSFLLEAKQYKEGTGIASALRAAFRQALDTAGTLRGSGYEADEAFIVLFRRGGARALLPQEPLEADGLRWFIRLIDIGDPKQSASRNRTDPMEWSGEKLRDLLLQVVTATDADKKS